jgi:hypothetical protein
MAELRTRRRQGRIEYKQPDGSWSTKKPPAKKGGALAKTENSKPENPRRTQARSKQAEAAKGTKGPNRVGQPAGAANRVYGANRVRAAVARAQRSAAVRSASGVASKVAVPLAIVNQIADIARVGRENQRAKDYGKAQKAAQSGQYGRYAKPSNQVKSTPAKSADTKPAPKPAPKPASKPAPKPASKPAPKPAAKPTAKPAAKAKEYYGPGGKPKRPSLKEQVADLKKSGTGSQRFKEMAEKARKEMIEKRRKDLEERRKKASKLGSRKPGSRY